MILYIYYFDSSKTRMASSSTLNSSISLHPALLLFIIISITVRVEGQPRARPSDSQILQDLFGLKISSLVLAHPEVSEGSAVDPSPLTQSGRGSGVESSRTAPRIFLNFLQQQRKVRGRSRKGIARGCFGMKVDRIGVISGLGC